MGYDFLFGSRRTRRTGRSGPGSFTWMLLLCCCMDTALCVVEVKGFLGGSAVLPCVYSEPLPDSVSVYWRDKDDRSVLDIVGSLEHADSQNQRFRGRVSSFPQLYKKGNFSVVMKDLKLEDQGLYECEVLRVQFKSRVSLKVSDKPPGAAGSQPGNPRVSSTRPPTGAAADWSTVHHLICVLLLTGFTLF